MSAVEPTILATSGGYTHPDPGDLGFGPLVHYAVELSGVEGRPKVCHLGTAGGDQRHMHAMLAEAGHTAGFDFMNFNLFPQPTTDDPASTLLDQDVIWVGGGSVANLLAIWRIHHLDEILHQAWQNGVVLAGISAGSICWFQGGPTDSFGSTLQVITNGLGFLPYGNGVHYNSEDQRRPLLHEAVEAGMFSEAHASDNGAGLVYRGTDLVECVTETRGAGCYRIIRDNNRKAVEERFETRKLSA